MKKPESINEIAQFLKYKGEKLKSLNLGQLKNVEEKLKAPLPKVYVEFLNLMGGGAGSFMEGSSAFYDELLSLQEWVEELIDENNLTPLPEDAVAFWMHQGYQAAFFRTSEGDDPPVYFFSEGYKMNQFLLDEPSLTKFFLKQLLFSYPELK